MFFVYIGLVGQRAGTSEFYTAQMIGEHNLRRLTLSQWA